MQTVKLNALVSEELLKLVPTKGARMTAKQQLSARRHAVRRFQQWQEETRYVR